MKFRLAEMADLPQLREVFTEITAEMTRNCGIIWNDYYPCELFEEDIENKALYILEDNGIIVSAFALYETNPAEKYIEWQRKTARALYIERFGVNVNYQRRGIASVMLEKAAEIAYNMNIRYLRLFVVDRNTPAINLYEKNGFKRMEGVFNEDISEGVVYTEFGYELDLSKKLIDNDKKSFKIAIIVVVIMLILFSPFILLGISYGAEMYKYSRIEHFYYANEEHLNELSDYFKNLYVDNLSSVTLNSGLFEEGTLWYNYRKTDEESPDYPIVKDISEEPVYIKLIELKNKYTGSSFYSLSLYIKAYYDNEGDMLLFISPHSEKSKKGDEIRRYSLVYIDENYDGTNSSIGIDTFGVNHKPFSENWHTWSEDDSIG